MSSNKRTFGALEEQSPMTPMERDRLKKEFVRVGKKHLEKITSLDDSEVRQDFKELNSVFGNFITVIYQKVHMRELFTLDEERRWKQKIKAAFLAGKRNLEKKEQRLFDVYMRNGHTQIEEPFVQNLVAQYQDLQKRHDVLCDGDVKQRDERQEQLREIEFELSRLKHLFHEVMTGRQGMGMLDEREKSSFRESIEESKKSKTDVRKPNVLQKIRKVFLGTPFPEEDDETGDRFADEIVDFYNNTLVGYKISLGIDSKYPKEKILAFFEHRFPEVDRQQIGEEIDRLLEERKSGKETLSTFQIYVRVMSLIFGKRKLKLLELLGGMLVVAGTSPLQGVLMKETFESKTKSDLVVNAGGVALAHYGQEWLKLGFESRLDHFLHTVRYGPEGIFQRINQMLFKSASPDLFRNVEAALLRRYVEDAVNQSGTLVRQSLNDIALPFAEALANAVAIAVKNPLLFIPTLISSIYADRVGEKKWGKIAELEEVERVMTSAAIQGFEEGAAKVRTHGVANVSLEKQLQKLVEIRSKKTSDNRKFELLERLWWPFIWLSNALLIANDNPNVVSAFAESTTYSMEMSSNLTRGIGSLRQIQSTIQPIQKLVELLSRFEEESGDEIPADNSIEIIDAQRRGLAVEHCLIKPGDTLLIIGGEGKGKSTFLELLAQFPLKEEESGAVIVGHTLPSMLNKKEYRKGILLSNQFFKPQTASLIEHFKSIVHEDRGGKDDMSADSVFPILEKFGFDLLVVKWLRQKTAVNEKVGTPIDEESLKKEKREDPVAWRTIVMDAAKNVILNRDVEPSGGQLKLMSMMFIDFALAHNPKKYHSILLDEPTAGVSENADLIREVVHKWRRAHPRVIMAIVDHRDGALFNNPPAGNATRILGIQDGKLVQDEPLSSAKFSEGVYRDLKKRSSSG